MPAFVLDLRDKMIDRAEGLPLRAPMSRSWLATSLSGSDVRPAAGDDDAVGELDVVAHRVGDDVVVRGTAQARLAVDCSRCLEDAVIDAHTELGASFSPRPSGPGASPDDEEVELTPDDVQRETYAGERIVLDDLVRELLLLEIPMKPLCDEACAGIPRAGGDAGDVAAAVDPRLAPLLDLKAKLASADGDD